ncbi:MAG: fibronectin type III domain-containing protein [Deltaproteobacteria bacterium]|nr:fibronectin type III domain-containing protein [Deltaproteobacteria bacterium]
MTRAAGRGRKGPRAVYYLRVLFPWIAVVVAVSYFFGHAVSFGTLAIVDHEACKKCHEKVQMEAMAMPYLHTVVDTKCGVCHIIGREGGWTGVSTASMDFKREMLFPLKFSTGDVTYVVGVIARDRLGKKSPFKEVQVDPAGISGLLSDAPIKEINGIKVEEMKAGVFPEVTLSWTTDAYAVSNVEYGIDAGYGESSPLAMAYSKEHDVILSRFRPGAVYHYRVVAKDIYGNVVRSGDMTFDTSAAVVAQAAALERGFPVVEDARPFKTPDGRTFFLVTVTRPSRVWLNIVEKAAAGAPHGDGFLPPLKAQIDVCVECHQQGASHPVGISANTKKTRVPPNLPTLEGGIITCVTCHYPHGGEKKHFARLDFERGICVECHTGEPYI